MKKYRDNYSLGSTTYTGTTTDYEEEETSIASTVFSLTDLESIAKKVRKGKSSKSLASNLGSYFSSEAESINIQQLLASSKSSKSATKIETDEEEEDDDDDAVSDVADDNSLMILSRSDLSREYAKEREELIGNCDENGILDQKIVPFIKELYDLMHCGEIKDALSVLIDDEDEYSVGIIERRARSYDSDRVCGNLKDKRSGSKYLGEIINGKPDGYGKMYYRSTGDIYEGDWKNAKPHGIGKYTRNNGEWFSGKWIKGKLFLVKEGVACVVDRKGNKYDGTFKDWKKHGYGHFVKFNGETYTGHFEDDRKSGHGILVQKDGSGFEGIFENDLPTREGKVFQDRFAAKDDESYFDMQSMDQANGGYPHTSRFLSDGSTSTRGVPSHGQPEAASSKSSNKRLFRNLNVFMAVRKSEWASKLADVTNAEPRSLPSLNNPPSVAAHPYSKPLQPAENRTNANRRPFFKKFLSKKKLCPENDATGTVHNFDQTETISTEDSEEISYNENRVPV